MTLKTRTKAAQAAFSFRQARRGGGRAQVAERRSIIAFLTKDICQNSN